VSDSSTNQPSRRDAIKTTSGIAVASALAGVGVPLVHAAGDETIRVALVGCGGRGTGAAENALATKQGPVKLVAMADVFDHRLKGSYKQLKESFPGQVDVSEERKFIGFDGYKKAMDCLKPGDIAIFATPPAFRWVHFSYAITKGLHVFMEKPVTVDGPTTKKMLKLADEASKKKLKVAVGLMCRHCPARGELVDRIRKGELGELLLLRAYRMAGHTGFAFAKKKPEKMSELLYQIQNFHAFLWASGGAVSDFLIHNIDECCWMKGAWPVQAQASGGRHYRGDYVDQNFDTYSVEYTFADGTKLRLEGRTMNGCHQQFASYVHGTRGSAVFSTSGHTPARPRIYKGQLVEPGLARKQDIVWQFAPRNEGNPYQHEWDHLMEAIRKDRPYNEATRGAEASLVTSMGRLAAHTGQIVTYKQMLDHEHEFAPDVDKLTMQSEAPLKSNRDGSYPVPEPGIKKNREY
jgi:predicted dehydrogenase